MKESGNYTICHFTVAIKRRYGSKDTDSRESDFISCVAWNGSAVFLNKYAHKGDVVSVEGRIQTSSYENSNGDKVYSTEVVAENVQLISKKQNYASISEISETHNGNYQYDNNNNLFMSPDIEISADDLPFY